MKKTFLSLAFLTACLSSKSQVSAGCGIGMKDTSGIIFQIKGQYQYKHIGFTAGMITTTPGQGPTYFDAQLFTPLRFDDYSGMQVHAGYLYRMVSADNKSLNGNEWVVGTTIEWGIANMACLSIDLSYTQRGSYMFILGFRGIFGEYKGCK